MTLPRHGAVLLAESAELLLCPAIHDDPLELRHRGSDRSQLRLGLPAATDQTEAARAALREMLRGNTARCAGPQLTELVRLEHRHELGRVGAKEENHKPRTLAEGGVELRTGVPELEVGRSHHGERSLLEAEPVPGPVLDAAGGHAAEAGLDRVDRVGRRQELVDILLREVERHAPIVEARLSGCVGRDDRARGGHPVIDEP